MHRPRRRSQLAAIAAGLSLMVTIPSTLAFGQTKTSAAQQPVNGGTLTVGELSPITALDPTIASSVGASGADTLLALYDTVVRYNPASNTYTNVTAKSLTSNAAHTVWTLKLRPGIKFSDGTPYDAEAVKESILRHIAPGSTSFARTYVGTISSITVVNSLTDRFVLNAPWGSFPYLLTTQAGFITSPTAVAKLGSSLNVNPVGAGAGPFILQSFVPGQSLTLVRNPDYWGGKVHLDKIQFVYYPSGAQTYAALKSGAIQIGFLRDQTVIQQANNDKVPGFQAEYGATDTIALNEFSGHPTASLLVRQAIAAAIDPHAINQRVYAGGAVVSSSPLPPHFPWNTHVAGTKYSLSEAQKLVKEAEAKTGWNGQLNLVDTTTPASTNWGLTVQALLAQAGITVNINSVSYSNVAGVVYVQHAYDLSQSSIAIPPNDGAYVQFEENFGGGSNNFYGYSSPKMDKALLKAREATTPTQKSAAYAAVMKVWDAQIPMIANEAIKTRIIESPNLHGIEPTSQITWDYDTAWLS
ncbi:MAG: hypothetical protein JWO62_59 [Acidimicrobiaceae bacterium]|nr:hypothetical protein [Acidimicrobiaceae bacterium]